MTGQSAFLSAALCLLLASPPAAAQDSPFYRFEETGASRAVRLYIADGAEGEARVIMLLSGVTEGYYDVTVSHNCQTAPVSYGERGRFHWWDSDRSQELDPFGFSRVLREELSAPDGLFHRKMVCDVQHIWGTRVEGLDNVLADGRQWVSRR